VRAAAGLIAVNALLLVLGLGLLGAAGLLRLRVRELLAAAPVALLLGASLAVAGGTAVLVAGGTLELPLVVAGAVVLAGGLWAATIWRLRRGKVAAEPEAEPVDRMDRYAFWAVAGLVVLFVILEAYLSRNVRPGWDASHNWMLKALAFTSGGLEGDLFHGVIPFSAAHLDYPIGQPVLGALVFRFAAKGEHGLLVVQLWILAGAFVLSGPFLTGRRYRAWLTMIPLALAAFGLQTLGLLRGEADVTVALFLGAGGLALARWMDGGPPGMAVVAAVLLGGAVNTKNEGFVFTLGVLAVAAVVLLFSERRRLLPFAGIVAGVAVLAAPWRVWVSANGPFGRDVTPLSTSLDLNFLTDRLGRLDFAAQTVFARFVSYGWILPAFVVVAVALIVTGPGRRVPMFYLGGVVITVLMILWVYWTTPQPDWAAHIQRTSLRIVAGPLFLAAAGLAHILPRMIAAARDP
jgi:hypothetical protein